MGYPNIIDDINNIQQKQQNDIDLLEQKKVNLSDLLDLIYPIGSIYMSVNNLSPNNFLGGTWVAIEDRFLLSAGSSYSAGSTGGEASHTLTVAETPAHSHRPSNYSERDYVFQVVRSLGSASTGRFKVASGTSYYTTCANPSASDYKDMDDITTASYTTSVGSGQSHNNMPPYLAVYCWKRTA